MSYIQPLEQKGSVLEEKQFIEQVKACNRLVLKLINLYAHSITDRNDLYQEILLNAWKGLSGFRADAKFSTWLYQVAINTILTSNRRQNRMPYQEGVDLLEIAVRPVTEERDELRLLYAAIRRLPEVDRIIISLHLEGYSNQEIAIMTGIKANHAGVKLFRIKEQLQNILNESL